MNTTSLKLTDALKRRMADAARQQGVTPHAFMVSAIERAAQAAEQRAAFVADALAARQAMLETGLGHDTAATHTWLRARLQGVEMPEPPGIAWRG